jgi:hypothetical protein
VASSSAEDDQQAPASQVKAVTVELRRTMHDPIAKIGASVNQELRA